jgi:hypothetical protein
MYDLYPQAIARHPKFFYSLIPNHLALNTMNKPANGATCADSVNIIAKIENTIGCVSPTNNLEPIEHTSVLI